MAYGLFGPRTLPSDISTLNKLPMDISPNPNTMRSIWGGGGPGGDVLGGDVQGDLLLGCGGGGDGVGDVLKAGLFI